MKRFIPFVKSPPVVSIVRLQGTIAAGSRGALSERAVAASLDKAFKRGKPKAVALEINSPGGSPVQSSLIASRIRQLADKHEVPVIAFVEDVAASGGYWLACAADEIFGDAGSIVGSIGVISASFGAHDFIERHGIERRVYTSGRSKSQLDPFKPENPDDVARLKGLMEQLHTTFIDHVKSRRGDRLADDPRLFTGEFWTGATALELGLIDGIGHVETEMRARFGDDVTFRLYGQRRGLLARFGASLVADVSHAIDERAAYARFGL
ncbi:S49 family peptidase [Pseudaestuariivita atlantica]|uniref:Multidrug transporter n=1 Tax=Pseudaestuariivita atlantica TaxID=1317121 RepID=A0A0L1JSG0_9RHOB|nr:S49 family peptidase [Pseudaestuariivita atlantica]KNG94724.1 multidrug transporter [Pseudaestuariivita atlantica]